MWSCLYYLTERENMVPKAAMTPAAGKPRLPGWDRGHLGENVPRGDGREGQHRDKQEEPSTPFRHGTVLTPHTAGLHPEKVTRDGVVGRFRKVTNTSK